MMPTLLSPDMVGMPHQHAPSGAYTVDTILNELSRQLVGHTRQFSRGSNGPQRVGNAMRICKPRSANNSPRSSTLQTPRRRLVGDGFQGRLHTQFPAQSNAYLPTAASEAPIPSLYEPAARPARPVSWHPSSQHHAQQPLFLDQDASNAILYPQPAYNDAEMWASMQHPPPTPAMYSGYTSPVESFSPLSLPFSSFSSQAVCSPPSQPMPNPQQHQAAAYRPSGGPVSETPYPRPPRFAEEDEDSLFWQPYAATTATAINNAVLHRPTAPPTPEDVGYTLVLPAQAAAFPGMETRTRTQQQEHEGKQDTQPLQQTYHQHQHQPIIHDDDYDDDDQEPEGDGGEGEILYGMGLYDAPDHTKAAAAAAAAADPAGGLLHHQSVMFSLLGSGGGGARDRAREEASDTGRGLGLKLEDAWEPPASDDDDDDDDDEKGERDGEGEGQEEEEEEE